MLMAALLSERTRIDSCGEIERSSRRRVSQVSSIATRCMDLYYASADDKEVNACFSDFQEIGEPPRAT